MSIKTLGKSIVALAMLYLIASIAQADVFNMGGTRDPTTGTWAGSASLVFVTVGDPGNAADTRVMTDGTTGYGSVGYVYQMGKYDVTVGQYCAFLNAVAKTDTYGLYNSSWMGSYYSAVGISRGGILGSYTYAVTGSYSQGANCPITFVTWGSAARFCNWLQNGQPIGEEGTDTTETGAYSLNGATTDSVLMGVVRNAASTYFIPSEDEWYKAAYYKGGGANAGYWFYPTISNAEPSNILSSTGTNNANFYDYNGTGNHGRTDALNKLTPVGAFAASPGPYDTFDMGGICCQWTEAVISVSTRGLRSGSWHTGSDKLAASARVYDFSPTWADNRTGFRVASVPEPCSIIYLLCLSVIELVAHTLHRRKKSVTNSILPNSSPALLVPQVANLAT